MGDLLPASSDVTIERGDDPTLLCIDDDRAEEVLDALESDTARDVFRVVAREPVTQSEITEAVDTSVQNVSYHVENLEASGLIAELGTEYSEKGREMEVYGPTEEPILLFLGSSADEEGLRTAFGNLVSILGPVAVAIAIKESLGDLFGGGDLLDALP